MGKIFFAQSLKDALNIYYQASIETFVTLEWIAPRIADHARRPDHVVEWIVRMAMNPEPCAGGGDKIAESRGKCRAY